MTRAAVTVTSNICGFVQKLLIIRQLQNILVNGLVYLLEGVLRHNNVEYGRHTYSVSVHNHIYWRYLTAIISIANRLSLCFAGPQHFLPMNTIYVPNATNVVQQSFLDQRTVTILGFLKMSMNHWDVVYISLTPHLSCLLWTPILLAQ